MSEQIVVTDVKVMKTEDGRPNRTFHIEVTADDWRVSLVLPEKVAARLQAQLHALDLTPPGLSDLKRLS